MPCPYARFVIIYEDGTQLIEDRNDPLSWDNAPKEGIWDVGIQFDPQPLYYPNAKDERNKGTPLPIRDPVSGIHLKERYPLMKLKGRRFIHVQWFRMVDFTRLFGKGGKADKTLSLMVGYVYNPQGDCVIMFGKQDRTIVCFQLNLFDMHADEHSIEAMKIDLAKCGMARETRQLMIKPEEVIAEEAG